MKDLLPRLLATCLILGLACAMVSPAGACPGCKEALANQAAEDEEATFYNPAHAYSYSVLFMLAVPATLLTVMGTACYVMTRKNPRPDVLPPLADDGRE